MNRVISFFLPKETKFFDMLNKQSETVLEASEEFANFLKEYDSLNDHKKRQIIEKIKKIEDKGDTQTYDIIECLNKSLVTPFDREDIHELAGLQDDILDLIDENARKLILYKIDKIPTLMKKQAELIYELVKKIHITINNLTKLKEAKRLCEHIYSIENKGDTLYEDSISQLFENNNAIEIIKFKDMHEGLEEVFDKGTEIADIIQAIVIKYD
ncbi:MAG: hypothetical protein COT15_03390 [Candidatus Diapherotrites archaeon CG08_land_8_20_14_0_20_34_12]|nr:MAG: hypothetical protein COT15_03390 [Candidatus Diapherotrites archaeon CG08_land_8_20_14_0_20_34_12]